METKFRDKLHNIFKDIKISYVTEYSVHIITRDDIFYEFHRNEVNSIQIIAIGLSEDESKIKYLIEDSVRIELCHKNIIDIKSCGINLIGLSASGKLYVWCIRNNMNTSVTGPSFKQTQFKYVPNKQIKDFSLGPNHVLALTIDGCVYGYGDNRFGQIGSEEVENILQFQQIFIKEDIIKAVACGLHHSIALTESGVVYGWGSNQFNQIVCEENKIFSPNKFNLSDIIIMISCVENCTFLLSSKGYIYVFGSNRMCLLGNNDENINSNIIKIESKIIEIATHERHMYRDEYKNLFASFLTDKNEVYIWGKINNNILNSPERTEFTNISDLFEKQFEISYNTQMNRIIDFKFSLNRKKFYKNFFIEYECLGSGNFGNVYRAVEKHKYLHPINQIQNEYAIKKFTFKEELENEFINELAFIPYIHKTWSDLIVKYYNIWIESVKPSAKMMTLYIQMELCDKSLKKLIEEIKEEEFLYINDRLTELGYYVCCKIFIQILKGVQYLHEFKPSIIHRDLNPGNILVKFDEFCNYIIKIADFGLSTAHFEPNQSHSSEKGNLSYLAPEVEYGNVYDTRADIYSLGIVMGQIFDIDHLRQTDEKSTSEMMSKYQKLVYVFDKMTITDVSERFQTIEDIINIKSEWHLNKSNLEAKIYFTKNYKSINLKNKYLQKVLQNMNIFKNIQENVHGEFQNNLQNSNFLKNLYGNLGKTIKFSTITDDALIIITNDDIFYKFYKKGMYSLPNYLILLNDNNEDIKSNINNSIVPELCLKEIIDVKFGSSFSAALSGRGELYLWGHNNWMFDFYTTRQESDFYKPFKYPYFENKIIREIMCSYHYIITLTTEGEVYSIGFIDYRQSYEEIEQYITPKKIDGFDGNKIKSISCGAYHSMVLTENGLVYAWGNNFYKQIDNSSNIKYSEKPILLNSSSCLAIQIRCGKYQSYFLTNDGTIHAFGDNRNGELGTNDSSQSIAIIRLNETIRKFKVVYNSRICEKSFNTCYAITENKLLYVWGNVLAEPELIESNSLYDCIKENCAPDFKVDFGFSKKFDKHKEKNKLNHNNNQISHQINQQLFKVKEIDSFKTIKVMKVSREMAYKIIDYIISRDLNQYQDYHPKLRYLLLYHDIWLESDQTNDEEYKIFIKMDYYEKNLHDVIDEIKMDHDLFYEDELTTLGFYIACRILLLIIQGLNNLHGLKKQITHKYLSPFKILMKNKFFQLCISYLNLSENIPIEKDSNYLNENIIKYLAPEVKNGSDCHTTTDIYSLGIIIKEFFGIDFNRNYEISSKNLTIKKKYEYLKNLCMKMCKENMAERISNVNHLLDVKEFWFLNNDEFDSKNDVKRILRKDPKAIKFIDELIKDYCLPAQSRFDSNADCNYSDYDSQ